ncbi:MAG: hypothetical protein ABSF17_11725 [Terracidiphilus sp.]
MMTATKQILPAFGALVLALLFVPNANAECGGFTKLSPTHTDWQPQAGSAHLVRAAFSATDDERPSASVSIVGMWHVHFVAQGNSGIPDGTEIDAGYSQWHSDGTEIMNSGGRNPNTGAFCLGVWETSRSGAHPGNGHSGRFGQYLCRFIHHQPIQRSRGPACSSQGKHHRNPDGCEHHRATDFLMNWCTTGSLPGAR